MQNWYCAGFMPQKRALAISHLERQGYKTFCPEFTRTVTHARKKIQKRKPLFPGYLFVSFDKTKDRWHPINSTIGITQLIQTGRTPTPVRDSFIKRLLDAADSDHLIRFDETLRPGDRVRTIGGAMDDAVGTLCRLKDGERVVVLMQMLGREVEVTVPRKQLLKVH